MILSPIILEAISSQHLLPESPLPPASLHVHLNIICVNPSSVISGLSPLTSHRYPLINPLQRYEKYWKYTSKRRIKISPKSLTYLPKNTPLQNALPVPAFPAKSQLYSDERVNLFSKRQSTKAAMEACVEKMLLGLPAPCYE